MRRCLPVVAIVVCLCPWLRAQNLTARSAEDNALPSPNQSLSIDEGPAEAKTNDPVVETEKAADAPESAFVTPTGDRFRAEPITILGKKRGHGESDFADAASAKAPWYRTSFGALGLVLALMGVLYFALKRYAPAIKTQDGGLVQVVSRTVVGPRQSVVLLLVGKRVVLVGVSPDRMDRVCEIDDAEEVAALMAQAPSSRTRGPFTTWLDREAQQFANESKRDSERGLKSPGADSSSLTNLLQKLRTTKV